jgi:hypothetical protein
MDYLQFAVAIPIVLLAGWVRHLSLRLDRMKEHMYTKQETNEMIDLKQAPMQKSLEHIETSLTDIKTDIQRLLDK